MTKQVTIGLGMYRGIKPDIRTAYAIATGTLIAIMSLVTSVSEHSTNAQMMMGNHGGFGNVTSGLQELDQKVKANGTINLEQTIFKAIDSKINTSLTQAMTIAESSVANNSFALAAFGGEYGGYFAYQIILGTPEMKFYNVVVDPGNGQILATQKVAAAELEKMHREHSAEVVSSSGSGASSHGGSIGFPFLIPH